VIVVNFIISIVTIPQVGWSWVHILVGRKDFSFLENFHTGSGAHPVFYIRVQGFFLWIKVAGT
jgi:hypothetical protein